MLNSFSTKTSYKWMVLVISFFLMLVFAVSLQALPPLFNNMLKDISFSNSQGGLLMSSYSILGIFIPFIVTLFLEKFNLKTILIFSLILVIIGLIGFSFSPSYGLLLANRLLSGAGSAVLIVLAPLLITIYFDDKDIGIAMGIFNAAVPLGTVFAANIFGYLGLILHWKAIITGVAFFTILVLGMVIFFLIIPNDSESKDFNSTKLQFNLGASLWLLSLIWMISNGQQLAYTTFGPQFFTGLGMTTQKSGFLTSMIMLVSIFLAPIVGILIDKTKKIKPFMLIGSILIIIGYFAITTSFLSLTFWAIVLGTGFSFIPVCIFSLLAKIVKPEHTSMGLAVITSASCLGISLGPVSFGTLLDKSSGNFTIGFIALSLLSIINIIAIIRIKLINDKNIFQNK